MKLVGLDPSLTAFGVAHYDGGALDSIGVATIKSKHTGCARLADIRNQVASYTRDADLVAIEGYSLGTARQQSHAHALGELGGVIRLELWEARIPFVEVPPATLKKLATGRGNGTKDEVLACAIRRLGYPGSSKDEADARWVLEAALQYYREPALTPLPEGHTTGLGKVSWPRRPAAVAS